jgi:hypothetical protein
MNYLLIISALVIAYYVYMVMRHPRNWLAYLHLLPVVTFTTYARLCGMHEQAWTGAFELAGIVAVIVIAILWHQRIIMDRIMLGVNIFLIIGAAGFLLNSDTILDWYGTSKGGPLFCSIAAIGLITTIFSPRGFIGVVAKKKETVQYSSFLLLAVTFIALVWSVSAEMYGLLWAVVLPLVILKGMREQLVHHLL